MVCGPQGSKNGLGWAAGERKVILYAGDGRIAGRDHKWVQDALSVTVEMLQRMGLETNIKKSKTMVCTTDNIWGKLGEHAYRRWATGEGSSYR